MDDSVAPAGFKPFDSPRYVLVSPQHCSLLISNRPVIANTTFYAEFDSYGGYKRRVG